MNVELNLRRSGTVCVASPRVGTSVFSILYKAMRAPGSVLYPTTTSVVRSADVSLLSVHSSPSTLVELCRVISAQNIATVAAIFARTVVAANKCSRQGEIASSMIYNRSREP